MELDYIKNQVRIEGVVYQFPKSVTPFILSSIAQIARTNIDFEKEPFEEVVGTIYYMLLGEELEGLEVIVNENESV